MNAALILGDSEGYAGAKAYAGIPGATYKVSFWLRGKARKVSPSLLFWPGNPADAGDRHYGEITGLGAPSATGEWTQYRGTFAIPSPDGELANIRSCADTAPWRLTWKLDGRLEFAALWQNEAGDTSLVGDGWGQRDYRNTDVGAILPYIIRRREAGAEPSVFVSIFEGYRPAEALVKSLRRLPLPEAEAGNTVAVAVETVEGTDYFVSCLEARPLQLKTPGGLLEVCGRLGAVSVQNGQPVAASLVEGNLLRWNGQTLAGQ